MNRDTLFAIAIPLLVGAAGGVAWGVRASRRRAGGVASEGGARGADGAGWERVSGIVALTVGVLALGVTSYTAYLQRRQAQAAVWPRVTFGKSDLPTFHLTLANKGVGPAIVRYVEVRLDDRPVPDWETVFATVLGEYEQHDAFTWGSMNAVLTPGESRDVLTIVNEKLVPGIKGARKRIQTKICYCSIFDECWMVGDGYEEAAPVGECPARGASSFKE